MDGYLPQFGTTSFSSFEIRQLLFHCKQGNFSIAGFTTLVMQHCRKLFWHTLTVTQEERWRMSIGFCFWLLICGCHTQETRLLWKEGKSSKSTDCWSNQEGVGNTTLVFQQWDFSTKSRYTVHMLMLAYHNQQYWANSVCRDVMMLLHTNYCLELGPFAILAFPILLFWLVAEMQSTCLWCHSSS